MLKGFDSFEVTLGDEMRGERASLGKSLLDVQRDLRIGADYIAAIENADASAFPFPGFAAGYVRSYARYLRMDADQVYRRFCAESGLDTGVDASGRSQSSDPKRGGAAGGGARRFVPGSIDDAVITNRFLAANRKEGGVSIADGLRGLASVGMLAALVGGLGYGGWSMLQNLQRVGFAPLPTAPDVQVSAPDFFSPEAVSNTRPAEKTDLDEERVTLAAIYAAQEAAPTVSTTPRDGPISSIDPARAGIYARSQDVARSSSGPLTSPSDVVHDAGDVAGFGVVDPHLTVAVARLEREVAGTPDDGFEAAAADENAETSREASKAPPGVHVLATDDAWVRIRDGARRVLFSGTLGPGESFALPEGALGADLRAGNAGAVYIVVNGEVFGPLGEGPAVAKNVSLEPADVRSAFPAAEGVAFASAASATENDVALRSD